MAKYVYQFDYNGFKFGNGTPYSIIDIDGLASQPDLRVQDAPRGYNDGFLTGRDFFNGRSITFTINIFAGNGNSAHQNWLLLQKSLQPVQQLTSTNSVLQFNLDYTDSTYDFVFKMNARVRTRKAKIDPEYTYGFIKAQVEMFAPDYRYYSNIAGQVIMTQPQLAAGRLYDRTYNMIYTQALPGNALATGTINNTAGTAALGPVITITGGVKYPQITNLSTGAYVQLAATFASTDTVVIDMTNNLVTVNGNNARNYMTGGSQFFTIPAGTSQNLYFTALSPTGQASATSNPAYA